MLYEFLSRIDINYNSNLSPDFDSPILRVVNLVPNYQIISHQYDEYPDTVVCAGGILDRVDSYMFTGALAYSFVKILLPLNGV